MRRPITPITTEFIEPGLMPLLGVDTHRWVIRRRFEKPKGYFLIKNNRFYLLFEIRRLKNFCNRIFRPKNASCAEKSGEIRKPIAFYVARYFPIQYGLALYREGAP